MSNRSIVAIFALPTMLAATLLVAGSARSVPLPKDKPKAKAPDAELPAEPVEANRLDAAKHRAVSSENLKQITLATINCADAEKGRLPRNITDKDGKPLLSWRVQLLPYLEQGELYKQFNLDEPWDSETNLKALAKMPKVFASPRVTVKKKGYTVYQGFAGVGAAFDPGKQLIFPASFTDGTSNTILAVESSVAVPWTKPADLPFNVEKDLPDFGKSYKSKPLAALCDGSVRTLDLKKIKPQTLKNAITTAGGEVLDVDWNE